MFHQYSRANFERGKLVFLNEKPEALPTSPQVILDQKQDFKQINRDRINQDLKEVKEVLIYVQDDLKKEAVADLTKKLEELVKKAEGLDSLLALQELEGEIYREINPILKKVAQKDVSECKNMIDPQFEKQGMSFTYKGEKVTAKLDDYYRIKEVNLLGITVKFQESINFRHFDQIIGDGMLAIVKLVNDRLNKPQNLVLSENRSCYEFSITEGKTTKKFVVTSMDILEVKKEVSVQKKQEVSALMEQISDDSKNLYKQLDKIREMLKNNEKMTDLLINFGTWKHLNKVDTGEFSAVEKEAWGKLLDLIKQNSFLTEKMERLEKESQSRLLETTDPQKTKMEVIEDFDTMSNFAKWTYMGKDGNPTKSYEFNYGRCISTTSYLKDVPVLKTSFNKNGLITRTEDLIKNTTDIYEDGVITYRHIVDKGKDSQKVIIWLYDKGGELMDGKTLDEMPLFKVQEFFLKKLNENNLDSYRLAQACFSAIKYISPCPRGKEILLKVAKLSPLSTFDLFKSYRDTVYASNILDEAAAQLDPVTVIECIKTLSNFPESSETRLINISINASKQKTINYFIAKNLLNIHEEPKSENEEFGDNEKRNIAKLLEDPAFREVNKIDQGWLDQYWEKWPKPANIPMLNWKTQIMVMIARNLYFQELEVNQENVQKEFLRIVEARKENREVTLFKGRNVLHLANSETSEGFWNKIFIDEHRFGKQGEQEAIKADQQKTGSYQFFRPENNLESIRNIKILFLEKLQNTPSPLTFLFDGHGGPDALYISDGKVDTTGTNDVVETQKTIKITVTELAQALVARAKKFPQSKTAKPSEKTVLMFDGCYNSSFIRALNEQLGDLPKPIAIGTAEYGQFSYGEPDSKIGSKFLVKIVKLGKRSADHPATIGDIFDNEFEDVFLNPSIYTGDQKNTLMQITQNDQETGSSARA